MLLCSRCRTPPVRIVYINVLGYMHKTQRHTKIMFPWINLWLLVRPFPEPVLLVTHSVKKTFFFLTTLWAQDTSDHRLFPIWRLMNSLGWGDSWLYGPGKRWRRMRPHWLRSRCSWTGARAGTGDGPDRYTGGSLYSTAGVIVYM